MAIQAIIFDLDGTLVQTERIKAHSYALAVQKLRGLTAPDERAFEAYRDIVGSARDIASRHIVDTLGLAEELAPDMARLGVDTPEQALSQLRVDIYNGIVADPAVIRDNAWPHTTGLLRIARDTFCFTALATMSQRAEAEHVLTALGLYDALDLILSREDVEKPKPDPEIYTTAAARLKVAPSECLVLEDSPAGVRAGLAAGANVIAIATPFTECHLMREELLPERWMVREPDTRALFDTVRECLAAAS